jgi:DNA replication protein DnaC
MDRLSQVTLATTDGLQEQCETKEPKDEFDEACKRIGLASFEHIGDWNTFQVLNPRVPKEVIERFLLDDNFIQRIEAGLDKHWERRRQINLEQVRRGFTSIKSISALTSQEILKLVKSKSLLEWMKEYEPSKGALLVGPTETGKTISVYGAMQFYCENMIRPANIEPSPAGRSYDAERYVTEWEAHPNWPLPFDRLFVISAREIGNIRDRAKLGEDEPSEITKARTCSLLVMDDLGWERPHQSQAIADVLASRYDEGVSTIATSGLTLQGLSERYGDAVIRRVCETAGRKGPIIQA